MNAGRFMTMLCMLLAGCDVQGTAGGGSAPPRGSTGVSDATEGAEGPVLAWVNEIPIYETEIDLFLESRMNLLPFQTRDEELRDKVLKSVIASRAMAQVAERELSESERLEVAMKTAFFREELLAKRYLEENAQPKPVSREMVREYYDSHPEEFGQRSLKEIEWLATVKGLDVQGREALLPSFQSLDSVPDWQGLATQTNDGVVRVDYKRGVFAGELLNPRLRAVVASTPVDGASGLLMIDGRLHRIRVLTETLQPAEPIGKVSSEIRQRLAPLAMRESVQTASDAVMAQVEVRYPQRTETE